MTENNMNYSNLLALNQTSQPAPGYGWFDEHSSNKLSILGHEYRHTVFRVRKWEPNRNPQCKLSDRPWWVRSCSWNLDEPLRVSCPRYLGVEALREGEWDHWPWNGRSTWVAPRWPYWPLRSRRAILREKRTWEGIFDGQFQSKAVFVCQKLEITH